MLNTIEPVACCTTGSGSSSMRSGKAGGGKGGSFSSKSREWYPKVSTSSSRNTEGGHSYGLAFWMKAS
eukprot:169649-Amphidinium_carterae.1